MTVPNDVKTFRAMVIAALICTAIWCAIFIGVGIYFAWSNMALWFLSLATLVFIIMAGAGIIDAYSDDDDDDDDEHKDNYIG